MPRLPIQKNRVYQEDCLKTMKRMPDNFVDLTVTSPPYDNLRTYKDGIGDDWGEHVWKPIIESLYRVTKEGGVVVWVVGDATIKGSETGTSFRQAMYFKEIGFRLHDTIIYHKEPPPTVDILHHRYYQHFEYMFVFSKGKPVHGDLLREKKKYSDNREFKAGQKTSKGEQTWRKNSQKSDKVRGNVWKYNVGLYGSTSDRDAFAHPAIFPEDLAQDHIISWSNEGDLVYDPFLGSGTTAKMALMNKRDYIGSEISKEYCDIALKRIAVAI